MAKKKLSTEEKEQPHLPGAEEMPRNERVHRAAQRYANARDERMEYTKAEHEAHDSLVEKMTEEGLESYVNGSVEVHLDTNKKAKVKIKGNAKKEDDGEEGD